MRTHYDVLNLGKNCSAKEIKDSFLKLSKIYHPDRNKRADAHSKFVEVNEAYSVLGKTESRLRYDESLCARPRIEYRTHDFSAPSHMKTYEYYANMYAKERGGFDAGPSYFNKSKLHYFFFCCILMIIGSGLQLKAFHNRRRFHSHQIALSLQEARTKSMIMNKDFIEELKKSSK